MEKTSKKRTKKSAAMVDMHRKLREAPGFRVLEGLKLVHVEEGGFTFTEAGQLLSLLLLSPVNQTKFASIWATRIGEPLESIYQRTPT